jgi:hypothetical protein
LGRELGLQTRIRKAAISSCYPGYQRDKFLPKDEMVKLLSKEAVEKALTKCHKYEKYPDIKRLRDSRPNLKFEVQSICSLPIERKDEHTNAKTYRKIFIVLVLIKKASVITSFINGEICDDDLPFRLEYGTGVSEWKCLRSSGRGFPSLGFQHLREGFFINFTERQWIVLAPYFDPSCLAKDDPQVLMKEQIPPFTSWKPIPDGDQGGCGEVFKVHIHPSQHRFTHVSVGFHYPLMPVYFRLTI